MQVLKAKIKTKRFNATISTDKTIKAKYNFGVGNNGKAIEIETPEVMESLLISSNEGKIYKYVGVSNDTYIKGNYYLVERA